ncbi:MAG TPA: hypothetical protein PLO37_17740 [Candidatus Hydrogenedentes bacterium]|nr:hypothetical protein [Candidatus Hydrogenedentota bacterium]HPG68692.1 hypothetical protein [Candidatus Hydrogenedentota bacterium]
MLATKLRKLVEWLWRNKERMILAIVVVVLILRVWEVLNPAAVPLAPTYAFPRTQWPEDPVEVAHIGFPGPPPLSPPPPMPENWKPLWQRNPFWYNAESGGAGGEDDAIARDPGIYLTRIAKRPDGKLRARLRTPSSQKWYDEGEQFEKYELVSIDEEKRECVVFLKEFGRRVTLTMQ